MPGESKKQLCRYLTVYLDSKKSCKIPVFTDKVLGLIWRMRLREMIDVNALAWAFSLGL